MYVEAGLVERGVIAALVPDGEHAQESQQPQDGQEANRDDLERAEPPAEHDEEVEAIPPLHLDGECAVAVGLDHHPIRPWPEAARDQLHEKLG